MHAINYFWQWFTDNQKYFLNLLSLTSKLRRHYVFWLEWHLNYYSKGIGFIILFPKGAGKKAKLIITAKGNPDFFDKVESVVAAAPKFLNWEIIAFVQPYANIDEMADGLDKPFNFKGISLKASDIKFEPFEYEGIKEMDIIFYLKYDTISEDYKDLMQIVYIIVESIVGEKLLHENINFVELAKLPEVITDEMLELCDLKLYIEMNRQPVSDAE